MLVYFVDFLETTCLVYISGFRISPTKPHHRFMPLYSEVCIFVLLLAIYHLSITDINLFFHCLLSNTLSRFSRGAQAPFSLH